MSDPLRVTDSPGVTDPLRSAARARPDAAALDDGARVWTYAELDAAVGRMARRLEPLGARPGSSVALVSHPSVLSVQAVWAISRTGAVLAPLNPMLGADSLERALDAIAPDLIVSTEQDVRDLALDTDWVTTLDDLPPPRHGEPQGVGESPAEGDARGGADGEGDARAGAETEVDAAGDGEIEDDEAGGPFALLWTSGTSGDPRAVPILSSALDASARASVARLGLTESDRWYASLSLGHIGGLALVHRVARVRCTLLVRGRFSAEGLGALIDHEGLTHASLVPVMLRRLLDVRAGEPVPTNLRCLLVGGAAAGGSLVPDAIGQGYPIALTYGLTEACSQVATAPPDLVVRKPGTVGAPMDGLALRLGDDGEISVRGDTVSPGATDEAGWLATGDLGRLDEDGHLWVTGRIGDRIVTGGATVDPRSVEVVLEGLADVSGAAVVGIPDEVWGESVVALIVPAAGADVEREELIAEARERLSAAQLPRRVEFADSLPVNANGKIDRDAVRAAFA